MSSHFLYSKMTFAPDGTFAEYSGAQVILLYKKLLRTSTYLNVLKQGFQVTIFGRLRIRNV